MTKKIKSIILPALLLCLANSAKADTYDKENLYPNCFVGVQGGGQITFGNYDALKLVTPQYGVQFGRWFTPEVGARLSLQGYQYKGGFRDKTYGANGDTPYKFEGAVASMDLLLNLSNICYPGRFSQKYNLSLVGGFGVNSTWAHTEYKDIVASLPDQSIANNKIDNFGFTGRLGLMLDVNLMRHLDLNFEVDGNVKTDNFNLRIDDDSWLQAAAFVGLTYRFGNTYTKVARTKVDPNAPSTSSLEYDAAAAAAQEAAARAAEARAAEAKALAAKRAAELKAKQEAEALAATNAKAAVVEMPEDVTFTYGINQTNVRNTAAVNTIVEWAKQNPNGIITVNGYADRGTGTPKINMRVSEQRAIKVADALKAKGVSADQLTVKAWGDTVQPFKENNKNRCVIVK